MLISKARDIFTDVMRDCLGLAKFHDTQRMQRGAWEAQIPADVRARLIKQEFVAVQKHIVYITAEGLEVLGYREATA
jgi:hypothetical protein